MGIARRTIFFGGSPNKERAMERFSFRRLDVYKEAMQMVKDVGAIVRAIPLDHRDLIWQIRRAARSVLLNIAEGAGEFAPREKARIYRIAKDQPGKR